MPITYGFKDDEDITAHMGSEQEEKDISTHDFNNSSRTHPLIDDNNSNNRHEKKTLTATVDTKDTKTKQNNINNNSS